MKKYKKHALGRLYTRHGKTDSSLLQKIENEIRKSKDSSARFISRESNSRTIWEVEIEERVYRVVYSKAINAVVTVLPTEDKKCLIQQYMS